MKTEAQIKKLIIEIHDKRKSTDHLIKKIEEIGQKIDADEPVSSKEFFKLAREFSDKHRELNQKEDEVFEFFQNTPLIKTDDPILRQKLKDTQNEYRELYKDKPYERVDSEGFINDKEWNYWIDEITYKIQDRPWSDLLQQIIGQVDPKEYGDRGFQLESLILSENIPDEFDILFKNLKLSYQFGLFNSVLICCRSVIEIGIKKYLKDLGDKPYKETEIKKKVSLEFLFKRLRQRNLLSLNSLKRADSVRLIANQILHRGIEVKKKEAYSAITDTHLIITTLFGDDDLKSYETKS